MRAFRDSGFRLLRTQGFRDSLKGLGFMDLEIKVKRLGVRTRDYRVLSAASLAVVVVRLAEVAVFGLAWLSGCRCAACHRGRRTFPCCSLGCGQWCGGWLFLLRSCAVQAGYYYHYYYLLLFLLLLIKFNDH